MPHVVRKAFKTPCHTAFKKVPLVAFLLLFCLSTTAEKFDSRFNASLSHPSQKCTCR